MLNTARHRYPARGFTLIEVLIAVVVLGTGLLAIALLQGQSVSNNNQSHKYTVASMVAQTLAENMRANRAGVIANNYNVLIASPAINPPVNCATTACSPAQRAQWDLGTAWALMNAGAMPNVEIPSPGTTGIIGSGLIGVTCADAVCTDLSPRVITIAWDLDGVFTPGFGCNPTVASDKRCVRLVHIP